MGFGIFWGDNNQNNISEDIPDTDAQTNQLAELTAAVRAVQQVIEQGLERVCIQTDSAYVHKGITCWINNWMANGWKTAQGAEVKHRVLWESLYDQCKKVNVVWRHVKGHASDPGNEAADILSKMATDRQKEATNRNVEETAEQTSTSRKTSAEKGKTSLTIKNQTEEHRGRAESEPQDVLTKANYVEIPKKSAKKRNGSSASAFTLT